VEKLRELDKHRSEGLINGVELEHEKRAELGRFISGAAVAPPSAPSAVRLVF